MRFSWLILRIGPPAILSTPSLLYAHLAAYFNLDLQPLPLQSRNHFDPHARRKDDHALSSFCLSLDCEVQQHQDVEVCCVVSSTQNAHHESARWRRREILKLGSACGPSCVASPPHWSATLTYTLLHPHSTRIIHISIALSTSLGTCEVDAKATDPTNAP